MTIQETAVRPFHINIPEEELDELRRRIRATRWPDQETVPDTSQGVQLKTMHQLADYWATEYDWRRCESRLNELPQFITEVDGLDIHFIHVRSTHEDALPIIVTHGWPGSIVEQLKVIEPLTNPTAHGGSAADAFHVVIPSLPGYGLSGKPAAPGWNPIRIAQAWATLMLLAVRSARRRLGERCFRDHWPAAAARTARHPHQHGGHGSGRHLKGTFIQRVAASRSHGR
jgi:hypothetical protein